MKTSNSKIINTSIRIIQNSGLDALTIKNLSTEMNVEESQLYNQFQKDDRLLILLINEFKKDLKEFMRELITKSLKPETELKLFFKGMYFLLLQRPHYLSIIFDKSIANRDVSTKKEIVEVKFIAETYLSKLINDGKAEYTFKTKKPTKILVDFILSDFRLLMKDEQRLNEMIVELKKIQNE